MYRMPSLDFAGVETAKELRELQRDRGMLADLLTLRPVLEYRSSFGLALWWNWLDKAVPQPRQLMSPVGTVEGLAYICRERGLTHWSPLPKPDQMRATDGAGVVG